MKKVYGVFRQIKTINSIPKSIKQQTLNSYLRCSVEWILDISTHYFKVYQGTYQGSKHRESLTKLTSFVI